jgi:GTP pyrophosphokinase
MSKLHELEDVLNACSTYLTNPESIEIIKNAYYFMEEKHKDQYRKSGEPYKYHLIEVAYILTSFNVGPTTIAAGFLHDTVEDTDTTLEEIEEKFGEDVAFLVNGATKIKKLSKGSYEDYQAENHRKIFIAMAKDIRVIIIKLADRLHNMRTLASHRPEKQKMIAKETIEIYAPIAHRLGMYSVKSELEDIALYYLENEKFLEIQENLKRKEQVRENIVIDMKKTGKFNIEEFKTKAEYSPFDGWEYQGTPIMTIVNGKVVMDKL